MLGKLVAMMKKPTGLMPALALVLVANLLLAATFGAQPAYACSCTSAPLEKRLKNAEAVFAGVAVDVGEMETGEDLREFAYSPPPPPRFGLVTLDVEESWKGASEEPLVVRGHGHGASCGIEFQKGERYLVFAYSGREVDASLQTGLCSGTELISSSKAERDLQALGPALLTLPGSVEPEIVASTSVGSTGREVPTVIVASGALLFVATLGALTYWRWRRTGRTPQR